MGIKYFFSYFKNKYSECITTIKKDNNVNNFSIDNLALDLNGIFHTSAQKIYKYGNSQNNKYNSLLRVNTNVNVNKQILVFEEVVKRIDELFNIVKPSKRLILCIDGIAGAAKMAQQRQRRFKNSENYNPEFDGNCITPGTKFMDHLSKYIDWFIKKRISENNIWQALDEVVFSSEKCPGEGEHKIMNYIRKYGNPKESWCINGSDADLIMLSLALHFDKTFIFRENMYNSSEYYMIDITRFGKMISEEMKFKSNKHFFSHKVAINDFIFMCFLVGNDFLPQIPTLEIIGGGIDLLINIYKKVCYEYGQLTLYKKGNFNSSAIFNKKSLKVLLGSFTQYEKTLLEEKINKKEFSYPDENVKKNTIMTFEGYKINMEGYKRDYYNDKFLGFEKGDNEDNLKQICHSYLDGMQWILDYYTKGISSWTWCYKYNFAPFSEELCLFIDDYKFKKYKPTCSICPFEQLLAVLPPCSNNLLPYPLSDFLIKEDSPIIEFYPKEFKVDLSGKKNNWEGVAILPMVSMDKIKNVYEENVHKIELKDLKRNRAFKSSVYKYKNNFSYRFESFYGIIENCNVNISSIEL